MISYFEKDINKMMLCHNFLPFQDNIDINVCNLWMGSKLFSIVHCTNVLVVRTTKVVQYLQKGNIQILESLLQICQRLKT